MDLDLVRSERKRAATARKAARAMVAQAVLSKRFGPHPLAADAPAPKPPAKPSRQVLIKSHRTTIVSEVKLTGTQRLCLQNMQNHDGRWVGYHIEYGLRTQLQNLLLIEERPAKTPGERRDTQKAINVKWNLLLGAVRKKDLHQAEKLISEIAGETNHLDDKAWWLTNAAYTYLRVGEVTITR